MISGELCEDLLTYAKLTPSGFHKINQTITLCQDFNKESYSIFIVNKDVLEALEEDENDGERAKLTIKGGDSQQAILCTKDQTFEISELETSNTLLIAPHIDLNVSESCKENKNFSVVEVQVLSSCNKIYDLKERRAKIGEVYKTLEPSVLHHHIEAEYEQQGETLYTFNSLLDKVMMSDSELKDILVKLKVYRCDGRLRLLHVDYVTEAVSRIIESAVESDCDLENISQKTVHSLLDCLYPPSLIDHILNCFFQRVSNDELKDRWRIDEKEIAKLFAEQILNKYNEIAIIDFMSEWQIKLPEGIDVSLSLLAGLVVINDTLQPPSIRLLKSLTLPDDPEGRFKELFAQKSQWKQEELEGYVQDIVPKNGSAAQLLVRHCRCSNMGSTKLFSKR